MNILGVHYIFMGEIKSVSSLILDSVINKREIYEIIRIEDGIPLFKEEHLKRLNSCFSKLNITPSFSDNEIIDSIHKLICIDNIKNENIKISCFINTDKSCHYYIYTIPSRYPSEDMYSHGVSTVQLYAERTNPNIKIAHSKVRGTANNEIEKQHVFEALLVNHNGLITEGSRSNLFMVIGGIIYTAPSELVLEGIIRSKVIEEIHKAGYMFKMECIHTSQISQVKSAFITGTSLRILPIKQIENHLLNVNHPLLKDLMKSLGEKVKNYKIKNTGTK